MRSPRQANPPWNSIIHLPTITLTISQFKTSHEACSKLTQVYATKSRTRAIQLKKELTLIQQVNGTMSEFLLTVKILANELALIDHLVSNYDLTIYVLNGLGSAFPEIAALIRTREFSLSFEKLYDLLIGHENYLYQLEAST